MHDAVLDGQQVNVALRGNVDLWSQTINVRGTYIPMSSLTRTAMPTLLTGPHGDNFFGVGFAVQGPLAEPAVIVKPTWPTPPGIIRKIFEMQAREETNR